MQEIAALISKEEHSEGDVIKLGQLLKLAGMCDSGVDAKHAIAQGLVKVNGETELQRGKKIRDKDVVTYHGKSIQIEG